MKTTVHIISHSHWDREWYQSFEKHRMKLIELVDNILEKAENDPEFGGFFLDGQTIALDDYRAISPRKKMFPRSSLPTAFLRCRVPMRSCISITDASPSAARMRV